MYNWSFSVRQLRLISQEFDTIATQTKKLFQNASKPLSEGSIFIFIICSDRVTQADLTSKVPSWPTTGLHTLNSHESNCWAFSYAQCSYTVILPRPTFNPAYIRISEVLLSHLWRHIYSKCVIILPNQDTPTYVRWSASPNETGHPTVPGYEIKTFRLPVRHSYHWAMHTPQQRSGTSGGCYFY